MKAVTKSEMLAKFNLPCVAGVPLCVIKAFFANLLKELIKSSSHCTLNSSISHMPAKITILTVKMVNHRSCLLANARSVST